MFSSQGPLSYLVPLLELNLSSYQETSTSSSSDKKGKKKKKGKKSSRKGKNNKKETKDQKKKRLEKEQEAAKRDEERQLDKQLRDATAKAKKAFHFHCLPMFPEDFPQK